MQSTAPFRAATSVEHACHSPLSCSRHPWHFHVCPLCLAGLRLNQLFSVQHARDVA